MSYWPMLFQSGLIYGLALSLTLTAIMIISGVLAADIWVGDYPPDIRQKYGAMSPRAARLRPAIAVLFFTAILAIPFLGLFNLRAEHGDIPFLAALVSP